MKSKLLNFFNFKFFYMKSRYNRRIYFLGLACRLNKYIYICVCVKKYIWFSYLLLLD